MLKPDRDRVRVQATLNGWILTLDTWNVEKQQWLDDKTWVYQSQLVLLDHLKELIAEDSNVKV